MRQLKHVLGWVVVGATLGVLAGCPEDEKDKEDGGTASEPFKAGWVYISPPGDLGWTYSHDKGRLDAEVGLDNVETSYKDNVPETAADVQRAIDELVAAGSKIIFTTSFGYMDPTLEAAGRHPTVKFEHCSGYKTASNMANYFGRIEDARYLTGIVAGRMTTANKIGYVAAFPIPEVIRGINSFTLGVRSVNPTATVYVKWTCTWYDPALEGDTADDLLDEGCDVLAQHQDSTAPAERAAARSKYAIGYHSDVLSFVPTAVLTSAIWNWGVYYKQRVQAARDGTWATQSWWGHMSTGVVDIGQFNTAVPQAVKDEVGVVKAQMLADTKTAFDGPFKHQDGTDWIAAGATLSDTDQLGMNAFVEGVDGSPVACQ